MRPCGAITHLRRPLATLPVLLMLAAPATAAAGEAPAGATSCVVLEPRTSFLASLHGALRTAAQAGNTDIHASPGLGRAILMYQRLESLPHPVIILQYAFHADQVVEHIETTSAHSPFLRLP